MKIFRKNMKFSGQIFRLASLIYCIVFDQLQSASLSMSLSEALPVCLTPREETDLFEVRETQDRPPKRMMEWTAPTGTYGCKGFNWTIEFLMQGTKRSNHSVDQRGQREVTGKGQRMRSERYFWARPSCALRAKIKTRDHITTTCSSSF